MKTLMLTLLAVFMFTGSAAALAVTVDSTLVRDTVGDMVHTYYLLKGGVDFGAYYGYVHSDPDSLWPDGTTLVVIDDQAENDWIADAFPGNGTAPADQYTYILIGAVWGNTGDTWAWAIPEWPDPCPAIEYTNWAPNCPYPDASPDWSPYPDSNEPTYKTYPIAYMWVNIGSNSGRWVNSSNGDYPDLGANFRAVVEAVTQMSALDRVTWAEIKTGF